MGITASVWIPEDNLWERVLLHYGSGCLLWKQAPLSWARVGKSEKLYTAPHLCLWEAWKPQGWVKRSECLMGERGLQLPPISLTPLLDTHSSGDTAAFGRQQLRV